MRGSDSYSRLPGPSSHSANHSAQMILSGYSAREFLEHRIALHGVLRLRVGDREHQGIEFGAIEKRLHAALERPGVVQHLRGDVAGIRRGTEIGYFCGQQRAHFVVGLRQRLAHGFGLGCGDHAGTARTHQDGRAQPRGRRRLGKEACGLQHGLDVVDRNHARLFERRAIRRIAARQRTGVRHRRLAARLAGGHLVDDDGLARRARTRAEREKAGAVAQAFEQEADHLHFGLVDQIRGQVADIRVAGIAGRKVVRETDAAHRRLHEHITHGARLRHQRHMACQRRDLVIEGHERQPAAQRVVHDADAVRTDYRHPGPASDFGEALLFRHTLGQPGFCISRGIDHDAARTDRCGFPDYRLDPLARNRHHHAVRRRGQGREGSDAGTACDFAVFRIDRVDHPRVVAQVLDRATAEIAGCVRCADDGDRLRGQHAAQFACSIEFSFHWSAPRVDGQVCLRPVAFAIPRPVRRWRTISNRAGSRAGFIRPDSDRARCTAKQRVAVVPATLESSAEQENRRCRARNAGAAIQTRGVFR